MTTNARNYLVCRVNTGMLEKLIGSASLYPDCSTYLCGLDGAVLYASAPHFQYGAEDIARLVALPESFGSERLSGGAALYTRAESPANGLIFLNIVPLATANRPIARLWMIFTVGLLLIAGLGALVITLVMRVNYRPLRKLGAMASHLGGEQTGDALHTVETALQSLHK
ncbi:MAG TPA: hypothetical protein PKE04_00210, partial [Clostridia bacterium]|nr:hypothetical protein [Clostridia bacterium]